MTINSHLLGRICILVACLATVSNHQLEDCVSRKFSKNAAKYPEDLSKGSSQKYTAYVDDIIKKGEKKTNNVVLVIASVVALGLGFFLGKSFNSKFFF